MKLRATIFWGSLFGLVPVTASAHSFGRLYNLPVPLWMYLYGAAAALAASFLMVAFFVTARVSAGAVAKRGCSQAGWLVALRRWRVMGVLRALSVGALLLCLATGFFGNRNPYSNFSMTFFWIVFVLMFTYVCALFVGDLFETLNPWKVIAQQLGRWHAGTVQGRMRYPQGLGHWPALVLYMGFIWIELFGYTKPFSLAEILLGYTLLNLAGVWLIGLRDWFTYCELFAVFMRLMSKMAPIDYARGKFALRWPFSGLLQTPAESLGLVVFVLFTLSSTAFDGLRATSTWYSIFWVDSTGVLTQLFGNRPIYLYPQLRSLYIGVESACLILSPFVYLAVYAFFMWLAKLITRSPMSLRALCLRFAYTLLPIALVYNITHYYTLIFTQGIKIVSLLSDPFGWGWNLFGTVEWFRAPILPEMGLVWHTQVGLILFGHIVSVYLAHVEALRTFGTPRQATLSQLPMLGLMMVFTASGLWILAQPISGG